MRHEIKIPFNNDFNSYFLNWKDFKNKFVKPYSDRSISSVYYDDDELTIAQDNLAGISNRKKYRVRWYNNLKNEHNYEIKIKKNNLGKKIILKSDTKISNFNNLFSMKNTFLLKPENSFFLKNFRNLSLKPVLQVNYLRSYYLYEGVIRLTFDRNLSYNLCNKFSFKNVEVKDNMSVLEIKFKPEYYNLVLKLIKHSKFVPKRFSKYLRGLYLKDIVNYV